MGTLGLLAEECAGFHFGIAHVRFILLIRLNIADATELPTGEVHFRHGPTEEKST